MLDKYTHEQRDESLSFGDGAIENLLSQRDRAVILLGEICERLSELNQIKSRDCSINGRVFEMLAIDLFEKSSGYGANFAPVLSSVTKKFDARFWEAAMKETRISVVMNASAKAKMHESIRKEAPVFDREHVYATLQHYLDRRWEVFVEGAIEVFQRLDNSFKSNDQICFRKRIIFNNAFNGGYWSMYGNSADQMDDLERIFLILDGKDPTTIEQSDRAINIIRKCETKELVLPYFRVKMFQNGNVHLYFTREDLVDKLNEMLANHYGKTLQQRTAKR